MKTELEQAEVTIKHLAKAANTKRSRKKGGGGGGGGGAAAAATNSTTAKTNKGSDGGSVRNGGGDGSTSTTSTTASTTTSTSVKRPSKKAASALAATAAVALSSSAGATTALKSHGTTATTTATTGSLTNASPTPSIAIHVDPGAEKETGPNSSAVEPGGRGQESKTSQSGSAVSAMAGTERDPVAVSALTSISSDVNNGGSVTAAGEGESVASDGTVFANPDGGFKGGSKDNGRGKKHVEAGTVTQAGVWGGSAGKEESTPSSVQRGGDHGRGQQHAPPRSPPASALSPAGSPGNQTDPSSTSISGKPRGGDGVGGKSVEQRVERSPKESAAHTGMATEMVSECSAEGRDWVENRSEGFVVDREGTVAGCAHRSGGGNARRGGGTDGESLDSVVSEERDDASDHLLSEVRGMNGPFRARLHRGFVATVRF